MLCRHLPNLKSMLSPDISKISIYFDISKKEEIESSKKLFKCGLLNSHLCINARTNIPHTECDSSYTVIGVPKQTDNNYKKLNPNFNFYINPNERIVVPMHDNICILFSGFMLTHNQSLESVDRKKGTFVNVATYGNKKLFDNMMKSFKRQI